MQSVFAPAVTLLNRLTYPRKFGLIGLLFALPLGLVTFFLVSELNDHIEFSAKEQLGNEYLRPVQQFASDLRDHRGLTWLARISRTRQRSCGKLTSDCSAAFRESTPSIGNSARRCGPRSCGPRSRANAGPCKAVRQLRLPSTRPIGTQR